MSQKEDVQKDYFFNFDHNHNDFVIPKMKKTFIYTVAALAIGAVSCKENVVPVTLSDGSFTDSTNVTTPEPSEPRRIFIEELSGVTCPNCPDGAEELERLSAQYSGQISIVTVHTGSLTNPIKGISKQNFQTEDGKALRSNVWGGEGEAKPTAIFDRLFLGSKKNKYFIDGFSGWSDAITRDKAALPSSPVNISLTSTYNEKEDRYDIQVIVKYTQAVTDRNALHIFLTESHIIDALEYSSANIDTNYEFNHVFRKAITPVIGGKPILDSMATKEAGRFYMYHTSVKMEPPATQVWKPENMTLTAFVTDESAEDKHVIQVADTSLVP